MKISNVRASTGDDIICLYYNSQYLEVIRIKSFYTKPSLIRIFWSKISNKGPGQSLEINIKIEWLALLILLSRKGGGHLVTSNKLDSTEQHMRPHHNLNRLVH